ncbi:MAG: UvrD-helicase domain-containing protein, partial [Chloroflexota bacterium]
MPLTAAQHSAIHNHDENLIVVAGAGSGKTFVLVERYLALLERHPEWALNSLVAITFTQKAAQEMRDRVRVHLQRQVDQSEGEAADRWATRLAAMDSARIDTIHGLCASILRGNAAEAGVDPGFEVLDEIEAGVLLDDALDDVFRALTADDPVLELFAEYGEQNVKRVTKQTAILPELQPQTDDLFTEWLVQWVADSHSAIGRFGAFLKSSNPFNPVGVDALSDRWRVVSEVLGWFQQQAEQTEQVTLNDYLNQLLTVASLTVPGKVHRDWGDFAEESKGEFTAIRDFAKKTRDEIGDPPGEPDKRAAYLLPLWIALAAKVRAAYRLAKDEHGALDFDDLEGLTCDLFQDDAVRARYLNVAGAGEFKHVLVDEFQDTNAAQWAIIRRLADPDQPGCLFVVGDPKQSIYGFRGADVSVFEQVKGVITAQGVTVDLDRSFRTHRRLVDCLNGLFEQILTQDANSLAREYEVVFGGGMQAERVQAPSDEPVLELLLLDKEQLKTSGFDEETTMREWEAQALAARIKALVEVERRLIFDKNAQVIRPMGYGDVALLFQAMTHVTLYEAALKAEGIPY